ncbi:MAG: hypothetical protein IK100_07415 [Muribaculaceae bacterium]|nr:hypothetical protein [Muribaculaceae bacterium]
MKRFFILLTILAIALPLMAADGNASDAYLNIANYATIDQAGATVSGMSSIYKYTEYEDQECAWLTISNYGARMADANQNWYNYEGNEKNAEGTWTATDIFQGSSSYFTGTAYYCNWNEAYQNFYVTNCTQVKQYAYNIQSSYNTGNVYPLKMEIYECTLNANGTLTPGSSTVDYKESQTTNQNEVTTSIDLDASKIYLVKIYNDYSRLFEIGFRTPLQGETPAVINKPVATDATNIDIASFTAHWSACEGATSYTLRVMPYHVGEILLSEGFSKFTEEGTTNIGNNLDDYMDNAGWWGSEIYSVVGGMQISSSTTNGYIITPVFNLPSNNNKITVQFKAKPNNADAYCSMDVMCGGSSESVAVMGDSEQEYTIVLDCDMMQGQVIFSSSTLPDGRVIITDLKIYSGDITDIESTRANVILDGEQITITGVTGTSYNVTELAANTTYVYDVKAIYGDQESEWSNPILATTLNDALITLGYVLEEGIDGEQYTIENPLAVADVADKANYAFLTDGKGNWICVTAANNAYFQVLRNNSFIEGNTLTGTLSGIGLTPMLTLTAAPAATNVVINFEIEDVNLAEGEFTPVVNHVYDIVGWWNESDGALYANAPSTGDQGQMLTLDWTWGAETCTLQDRCQYEVRCAINKPDAENFIAYALRLPDTPLAEDVAVTPLVGDVNGDGIVSSVDVTVLYNYLLTGDTEFLVNGDQDGDGVITTTDVTVVYNVLLGGQ